jgi:hypothetical protein
MIQDTTATSTPATEQTHDIAHPDKPESAQITEKQPKYLQKTLEAIKLVDNGADPTTALQITNGKANITRYAVDKFKAKYKKYSLANPSTVKSAHNQIKRILEAETRTLDQQKVTKDGQVVNYKETIAPSDSNILAAAAMVYDRFEPAKQPGDGSGGGLTVNVIPIAAQEIIERMMRWKNRQVEEVERKAVEEAISS